MSTNTGWSEEVDALRRDLDVAGTFLRAQENRLALPVDDASWPIRWERVRLALQRPPRTGSKTADRIIADADARAEEEGVRAYRYRVAAEKYADDIEKLVCEREKLQAEVARLKTKTSTK